MDQCQTADTVVELLERRAAYQPDRIAYTFLAEGQHEEAHLTYRGLAWYARTIGARLQALDAVGERVLLLFPSCLEYIAAFFGCLYAGALPVPAFPPRVNRPSPRIQAIAADAAASIALTLPVYMPELATAPDLAGVRCLAISMSNLDSEPGLWQMPDLDGASLAFLQYTSGSTTLPKGVVLTHRNLLSNLAGMQRALGMDSGDTGVSWLPLYHDMGLIGGVLLPLYVSAPLVLIPPTAFVRDPLLWLHTISSSGATISCAPNFAYQFCVDRITPEQHAGLDLSRWRVALCGAEPVCADTLDRFSAAFASCGFRPEAFCPSYGLAEGTLAVSIKMQLAHPNVCALSRAALCHDRVVPCDGNASEGQTVVACGVPLPGLTVAIVDPDSSMHCPPDCVGEIWVSGPSVCLGYWNRPEETLSTFRASIAGAGEGPFLRTGDLGFVRDGELFITGRLKDLIIIHGLNYHPHDIELVAEQSHPALHPGGAAAFSLVAGGEERLVIVHELRRSHRDADGEAVARAIRRAVAEEQELPVYTVALVGPWAIPRTTSGKIQHNLCRTQFLEGTLKTIFVSRTEGALPGEESVIGDPWAVPRTSVEMALAEIWIEVLGQDRIGIYDNFFELGGDSLKAAQVVSRLREVFAVEMPLRELFECPTISDLALQIPARQARGTQLQATDSEGEALTIPPLTHMDHDGPIPLSFAQERIWFLHQLNPQGSAYNISQALRLDGPLNREALTRALREVMMRHASFRTVFPSEDGQPTQVVNSLSALPLRFVDLRSLSGEVRTRRVRILANREARRPFDLIRGPLVRVCLLRVDDEVHILIYSAHHMVADAWSLGVLATEVSRLYNGIISGAPVQLPEPAITYTDFSIWQRGWLRDKILATQLIYWRKQLADVPILELPTDHPRPLVQSYRGTVVDYGIPEELLAHLRHLSRRERVSLMMVLLAAFNVLLCRYSEQHDIAVGLPVANRTWRAIENVVGTFVNTLIIRTDLSGDPSFNDLLHRVRNVVFDAFTHQDLPYATLVAELQPARDTSHAPLVQVMFNVINVPMPKVEMEGVSAMPFEIDRGGAQFDLTFTFVDTEIMRKVYLEYNTDLFEPATIDRLFGHYVTLLTGVVEDPSRCISGLPILTEVERRCTLETWNKTAIDYPWDACVHQLVEARMRQCPDAIALGFKGQTLTYRDLDSRSNCLAHYLQRRGVGPDTLVGLCVERSPEMVVGLLGILKAGGCYLPLDPGYPRERLAFMMEDAEIALLLTTANSAGSVPPGRLEIIVLDTDWDVIAQETTAACTSDVTPENLAYTIYTSGSTGKPKGVMIPHRAVVNFLWSMKQKPGLTEEDVLLALTSLSFDIAVLELFLPLIVGARVELVGEAVAADGPSLSQLLHDTGATVMQATPTTWQLMLQSGWQGEAGLKLLCGGEALPPRLASDLYSRCASLWNMYGPTETTVWSSVSRVDDPQTISIGTPINNTQMYILDKAMQPVPIGIPGDLYIGGSGLARGYLKRPELTAARFVPHPFDRASGARLYCTGDRARFLTDGTIDILGRLDHQIKLRGHRIELGEIEAVLMSEASVAQAAVIVEDNAGETGPHLVAYLVPRAEGEFSIKRLREFLGDRLPAYMIPAGFVTLDAIPLTPNGKVDRNALPHQGAVQEHDHVGYVPARDFIELRLIEIWERVLGVHPVGVWDNFFDLGGHSLLAVRLFSQITAGFGVRLPVVTLFHSPTVEQLATVIKRADEVMGWKSLVPITSGGSKYPFFCVHGVGGGVLGYAELARLLGPEQPFYALQAQGIDGTEPAHDRIETMAAAYVQAMRTVQPTGPYALGGYSFGGLVAYEMACQLHAMGEKVALLAMLDTYAPVKSRLSLWSPKTMLSFLRNLPRWIGDIVRRQDGLSRLWTRLRFTVGRMQFRQSATPDVVPALSHIDGYLGDVSELSETRRALIQAHIAAVAAYEPRHYPGRVTLFRVPGMALRRAYDPQFGWGELAAGGVTVNTITGAHYSILEQPQVTTLAAQLRASLTEVHGHDGNGVWSQGEHR